MRKLKSREEIRKISRRLRSEGRRIVFTNGCFDILHAGHVRYLGRAKRLGDVLIVGLNADRSVAAIKPGRPVNSEKHRAEVLDGLAAVDYIVLFSEKTPRNLIRAIRPDVLVKGGDWTKDQIVGAELVAEAYSLPYVRGLSTTALVEKIRRLACIE